MQHTTKTFRTPEVIIYAVDGEDYKNLSNNPSIEEQVEVCENVCREKGLKVSKILTSTTITDLISNYITDGDTLVIWAVNRLSTKMLDMHNIKDSLDKKKCRLISCCESFDSTINNDVFGLFGWISSMKMNTYVTSSSFIPFGLKLSKNGEYEQIPSQMEIIDTIKTLYFGDDELSYEAIADRLNSSGVIYPWTGELVKDILKQESKRSELRKCTVGTAI